MLDDDHRRLRAMRSRCPSVTTCETAPECISLLEKGWDDVFLDHDLGGEVYVDSSRSDTGAEVVRWLVANPGGFTGTIFVVHSYNDDAAEAMVADLKAAGLEAKRLPFNSIEFWGHVESLHPTGT